MSFSGNHPQTILFLVANPENTTRLRLDQELRDIDERLQRAQQREQFSLEHRLAVRPRDIQRAMLDVEPNIVHFSGHGTDNQELVFEDEVGKAKLVDGEALASLFALFADQVHCVVLNGCYSEVQAKAISTYIPYVIGMNQSIGDRAAITFAVGFYDALGAGKDIEFAYKLGCTAIQLEGIREHLTPILLKKSTTEGDKTEKNKPKPVPKGKLSEFQRRRLEEKRSDLEENYYSFSKRLKPLRRARVIETDPSVIFKLDKQIEELQLLLDNLEQELDKIEQELS